MRGALYSFYIFSIFWNLVQNFKQFDSINRSTSFEQYIKAKTKSGVLLYVEAFTSFYIIACLAFTPLLFSKISSFNKFLLVCYMLYLTYRFCKALFKLTGRVDKQTEHDSNQTLKEELTIMDEMIDVKALLLLEPITFIVLEAIFFVLSIVLLLKEGLI